MNAEFAIDDLPGYSPPAPNPAIPRPTIIIQNMLFRIRQPRHDTPPSIFALDIPELGLSMGSSCDDNAKDKKAGCKNDASPTSQLVDDEPESEHAEDFADEVGIR